MSYRTAGRAVRMVWRMPSVLAGASLVMACSQPETVTPVLDDVPRGVRFEQSVAELQRARSTVRYVPYGGWHEELPEGRLFKSVSYRFTGETPGQGESRDGRLWAVTMVADSAQSANSLVQLLDAKYGRHDFAGCASLPTPAGEQELAYLTWQLPSQFVAVSVAIDAQSQLGPPSLHLVKGGWSVKELSALALREDCRSRAQLLTLGGAHAGR